MAKIKNLKGLREVFEYRFDAGETLEVDKDYVEAVLAEGDFELVEEKKGKKAKETKSEAEKPVETE